MQWRKYFARKLVSTPKAKGKESKPRGEIRLETQIKNLENEAKMMKQRKDTGTSRDKKETAA